MSTGSADAPNTDLTKEAPPAVYNAVSANMVLGMLFLVAILNILDRKIIIILQEPIKKELELSDSQLGLLTGLAFSLVYVCFAFPYARYAERSVRKRLIAGAVLLWSALTALTGLVNSFAMLLLLRMGVAAGEAGASPASHSMISDLYPPERRVRAFAVWSLAVPAGTMLGYAFGGWLFSLVGWRGAMIVVGLFGVALAPFLLLIKEPVRCAFDAPGSGNAAMPTMGAALAILWKRKTLRYLLLAIGCHSFVLNAVLVWSAPFYMRVFEMTVEQISFYLAIVVGAAGGLGVWAGGYLASRFGRDDRRWYAWIPGYADLVVIPLLLVQFFVSDRTISMAVGTVAMFILNLYISIGLAQAHHLVVPRMRATVSAALMFTTSVIGSGLAPVVIGVLSDIFVANGLAHLSLRYAMLALVPAALTAATLFFLSGASLEPAFDPGDQNA